MASEGTALLMVGRSAKAGVRLLPLLRPEIDGEHETSPLKPTRNHHQLTLKPSAIHFCESIDAARKEIPLVLQGKVFTPESAIGSNATRGQYPRKPDALFVGAGFSDEDYASLRSDIGDAHGLPWARERKTDIEGLDREENWTSEFGPRIPKPEVLAKTIRKVVKGTLEGEPEYTSR